MRYELQAYFRQSRQALSKRGGILVMDLLGGHAAEDSVLMHRHNDTTGARFVWEQEGFNPVTRHIHCYITLRDPDTHKVLPARRDAVEMPLTTPNWLKALMRTIACQPHQAGRRLTGVGSS